VRLAGLLDAPYAFGSTYELEVGASDANWRSRLEDRAQFAAEREGEIVGTAGGVWAADSGASLVSMWVAPSARGSGAGDGLVSAVVAWAVDEGFTALRLWVTVGNDPAENLYLRHGFLRTGGLKPARSGEPRMEFEMVLPLGDQR